VQPVRRVRDEQKDCDSAEASCLTFQLSSALAQQVTTVVAVKFETIANRIPGNDVC
jgi:hypothetical protein